MAGPREHRITPAEVPDFTVMLRGYDRRQVDGYIRTLHETPSEQVRLPLTPEFRIVLRGYARDQVHDYLERYVAQQLDQR